MGNGLTARGYATDGASNVLVNPAVLATNVLTGVNFTAPRPYVQPQGTNGGTARVFTITVTALDRAGNAGTAVTTFTVR